ncbi:hypothetical protein, partial [Streptomyces afghaniensis]|uniref:hypothetical protein n=1 Tax=Streptomyces afghaniensis TaxID=66865 RepID=UPI0024688F31
RLFQRNLIINNKNLKNLSIADEQLLLNPILSSSIINSNDNINNNNNLLTIITNTTDDSIRNYSNSINFDKLIN